MAMSLLLNKYTIGIAILLAAFFYVKSLQNSLENTKQGLRIAKQQTLVLERQIKAKDKQMEHLKKLSKDKQEVVVRVEERVRVVRKLEKVYVQNDNGCSVSDDAFSLLTESFNAASGGDSK